MHSLLKRLGRLFGRRRVTAAPTPTPAIRILLRVPHARRPGCLPAELLPLYMPGVFCAWLSELSRQVILAYIAELEEHAERIFARGREVN